MILPDNKEDYSNEGQEILISTSCGRDDRQRFSTTAFASESELPVNEVIIGGDSLEYRAPNPPTLFYNLGGSGQYTATLIDLAANRGSYTKYYFATSTGEIYLKFDLERSGTTTNKIEN